MCRVGQNHMYIRCIYGIFGREIIKTVIYGEYIRFWPTLIMCPIDVTHHNGFECLRVSVVVCACVRNVINGGA